MTELSPPPNSNAIRWANLFSFRFWVGSFLGAVIAGALVSLIWEPLGYVMFFLVLPLLFYVNLTEQVYSCPFCKKRVKTGATHCHHCGREVKAA